jgi:hypothetical protein
MSPRHHLLAVLCCLATCLPAACGSGNAGTAAGGGTPDVGAPALVADAAPGVDLSPSPATDLAVAAVGADSASSADAVTAADLPAGEGDAAAPDVPPDSQAAAPADAAPDVAADGSAGPEADDTCPLGLAFSSTTEILAAFPLRSGLLLVRPDRLTRVTRAGAIRGEVTWPRLITGAVLDDQRLAVVDKAVLTTFDLRLEQLGRINLVESCAGVVPLGPGHLACGPANDWDRIFYAYDLAGPSLLTRSSTYTYYGIPMFSVQGRPWFMTEDAIFGLAADGTLGALQGFISDRPATVPIASSGDPATFVVDVWAKVYKVNPDCKPTCFENVGKWSQVGNASVQGLFDGPPGAVLQVSTGGAALVDVATGMTISSGRVANPVYGQVAGARLDSHCKAVTAVFKRGLGYTVEQMTYEGYKP